MLGKLLKYEIKATARTFLPLYAALLVLAAVNKLISAISVQEWKTPQVISMALYVIIFVGMFVMTLVVIIQRFYKNLLSDEGYLMFTLPVKTWKHIVGKLLVAMIWTVASGLTGIISIFIIAYDEIFVTGSMRIVISYVGDLFNFLGASSLLYIIEFILLCIISLASNALLIYASIALGHLVNQHRVLFSIGAFIALNTVSQILFALVSIIPGVTSLLPGGVNIPMNPFTPDNFHTIEPFIHFTVWYIIIFFGLLSAGYFVVTNYILSRRLNLE